MIELVQYNPLCPVDAMHRYCFRISFEGELYKHSVAVAKLINNRSITKVKVLT